MTRDLVKAEDSMTLKQIKYFTAIFECKNMTKAAEQLYVSRPVLSRALIDFEKELGLTLFIRTTNGVEPTEQGRSLYETISVLSSTFDETVKRLKGEAAREKRPFRIGIINSGGVWFYPHIFTPFSEANPDLTLNVESVTMEEVPDALLHMEIDCAISPLRDELPTLIGKQYLFDVECALCSSPENRREKVTLDDLKELPIGIFGDVLPTIYFEHNVVLMTQQAELLHMAIANGFAHAVLPMDLTSGWKDVSRTRFTPPISAKAYLLWNKTQERNEAFMRFRSFVSSLDFSFIDQLSMDTD